MQSHYPALTTLQTHLRRILRQQCARTIQQQRLWAHTCIHVNIQLTVQLKWLTPGVPATSGPASFR